eukprot:Ihof_evm3s103 gene=Ihof_evmTU3s103
MRLRIDSCAVGRHGIVAGVFWQQEAPNGVIAKILHGINWSIKRQVECIAMTSPLRILSKPYTTMASHHSSDSGLTQASLDTKSTGESQGASQDKLNLKNVLVVTKMSRYEQERRRLPHLSEESFQLTLESRGSMYRNLKLRHELHNDYVDHMLSSLRKIGSIVKTVCIKEYKISDLDSVDTVFSAGGDGTFLSAASIITNRRVPLVGINTDPEGSYGHLCLRGPDKPLPFTEILDRLQREEFRWLLRQRIGINMVNKATNTHVMIPRFSLNDCLFCDWDAAHAVSYYMKVDADSNKREQQKSSGVLVSTGTGSTAWTMTMNQLSVDDVRALFKLAQTHIKPDISNLFSDAANSIDYQQLAHSFNERVCFDPTDNRLEFTVREPIVNSIFKAN